MVSFFLIFYSLLGWSLSTPFAESSARGEVVQKTHYLINYNEDHEVANWVEYTLERESLRNCASRRNDFRPDPQVSTGSATLADYRRSGFDRGHLVPAGDMKISRRAMSETFFMSNMTPQPARFNQVQWNHLENLVRAWASKYGKLWIITGPVLHDRLPTIGQDNRVSVPEEYFKVLLRKENQEYKGIAFLVPTCVPHRNLSLYTLSIRELENYTQINFFSFIDQEQEHIEEVRNLADWDFSARFEYLPCLLEEVR
ncbi:MAG: DNA/RNA non-specific endonuclease [Candidatus Caldatribacteriota bacterium]